MKLQKNKKKSPCFKKCGQKHGTTKKQGKKCRLYTICFIFHFQYSMTYLNRKKKNNIFGWPVILFSTQREYNLLCVFFTEIMKAATLKHKQISAVKTRDVSIFFSVKFPIDRSYQVANTWKQEIQCTDNHLRHFHKANKKKNHCRIFPFKNICFSCDYKLYLKETKNKTH